MSDDTQSESSVRPEASASGIEDLPPEVVEALQALDSMSQEDYEALGQVLSVIYRTPLIETGVARVAEVIDEMIRAEGIHGVVGGALAFLLGREAWETPLGPEAYVQARRRLRPWIRLYRPRMRALIRVLTEGESDWNRVKIQPTTVEGDHRARIFVEKMNEDVSVFEMPLDSLLRFIARLTHALEDIPAGQWREEVSDAQWSRFEQALKTAELRAQSLAQPGTAP